MNTVEGTLFIVLIALSLIYSAIKAKKHRKKIKDRANQELLQETELTTKELETRLYDAEMMYEDLEQDYWLTVGLLTGLATYYLWGIWYISIIIALCFIYVGLKFLSIKPFSSSIPDEDIVNASKNENV